MLIQCQYARYEGQFHISRLGASFVPSIGHGIDAEKIQIKTALLLDQGGAQRPSLIGND